MCHIIQTEQKLADELEVALRVIRSHVGQSANDLWVCLQIFWNYSDMFTKLPRDPETVLNALLLPQTCIWGLGMSCK